MPYDKYAYTDNGAIRPIPENPMLRTASQGLGTLRRYLDNAGESVASALVPNTQLPVGSLLVGQSPEEIHQWAQGSSPFYQGTLNFAPGRDRGIIDTAFLPVGEAAGIGGLARSLARSLGASAMRRVIESVPMQAGRRQFMKNAGQAAVGTAVATPLLLRGLGKAAEHAAPEVAETATTRVVSPHDYHAMRGQANVHANHVADRTANDMYDGMTAESWHTHRDAAYNKAHAELLDDLHSRVEPYPTHKEINQKYNANVHGDEEHVAEYLKQGWLPTRESWIADQFPHLETVESKLKSGGEYVDPFTGNRASMRDGEIVWTNGLKSRHSPSGLQESSYQPWIENAHKANARQKLGLADEYGIYKGPDRPLPPRGTELDFPDPEPDYREYKHGGAIERTTYYRKIL
ncbi:MAG: hypothetical protein WCO52_06090 [bacterium]